MSTHDHATEEYSKTVFGFWVYLLTDFVLFSTILASYFVLRHSTMGGPAASDLLPLWFSFVQTLFILGCSLTSGLAEVMAFRKKRGATLFFLAVTFVLGSAFLSMGFCGLFSLVQAGHGWNQSAFLSMYFTLLGTHFVHVIFALLWILVLGPLVFRFGLSPRSLQRFSCLRIFWQFIGMIWIGVFTIVYLLGVS